MAAPVRRLVITCLFFFTLPVSVFAAPNADKPPPPDAALIISRAKAAAASGDLVHAVDLYASVSRLFPQDKRVGETLWQVAELSRRRAEANEGEVGWSDVRSMYRDFIVAAPASSHIVAAYLEIARINYRLRLFPEARSYLRLLVKKYPRSPLVDEVRFLMSRVEMGMGRYEVAEEYARKLFKTAVAGKRVRVSLLLAEILTARGRLSRAISLVRGIEPRLEPGSAEFLEALRIKGRAQLLMSDPTAVRRGRDNLFYYLNMIDDPRRAVETRLLLAEGFLKEKNYPAAKGLLKLVVKEVDPDSRAGVRARFRLAMIRDLGLAGKVPADKSATWESSGDDIFLKIIRRMDRREAGQTARYVLMRRMLVRGDDDGAYAKGRAYLVGGGGPWKRAVLADSVAILIRRYRKWLDSKEYARVYESYRNEYPVIRMYSGGSLLFLVGQALEKMGLYGQASVIYYRALGLKLRASERDSLYLHRARTYLAAGDLVAAGRLLKYLRGRYDKGAVAAEVRYLSGRLLLLRERRDEAMGMLDAAFKMPAGPRTLAGLIQDTAPLLIGSNRLDQLARQLDRCARVKCLAAPRLQDHYIRLADALRRHGRKDDATRAYGRALSTGDKDSSAGRKAAYYLGRGKGRTEGERLLTEVAAANTPLWSDLARAEVGDIRIKKLADATATRD